MAGQQKVSLFLEQVRKDTWLINLKGEPELICINGPYINQRIAKEVCPELPKEQIVVHATPTTHHDQHWHHAGVHHRLSASQVLESFNSDGDIKDDYTFIMESNFKMREEKGGCLISQNNCAYFVNNEGVRFLKLIGKRIRVGDLKLLCEEHGISEGAGIEFLRRLIMFGLYKAMPAYGSPE